MAKLKKGDKAPDFELLDQNDEEVNLVDYRGERVLLFFYPRAGTSGCTVQAESVRDAKEELDDLDVAVIGISPDSISRQKKFDENLNLGYPLLSDTDHTIAEAYGVWGEKTIGGNKKEGIIRSSFLIDENGKILGAWYKVKPQDTVPNAMDLLKK